MKRNFFCLVLKFTLSNTRFQSLRRLALKVTILHFSHINTPRRQETLVMQTKVWHQSDVTARYFWINSTHSPDHFWGQNAQL